MSEPARADERTPDKPLRILHLEDRENDALLIRGALEQEHIDSDIRLVSSREAFVAELEKGGIDLILSDFRLPGFDGLSALRLAMEVLPDTPCILVSGTIGEEAAIESLRGGATDYVLKDRLSRLGPAVRRAIKEAAERRTLERAEHALRREQHFLHVLLESIQTSIVACDATGTVTVFNRAARELHSLSALPDTTGEMLDHFALFEPDGMTRIDHDNLPLPRALAGEHIRDRELVLVPDGHTPRTLLVSAEPIVDEDGQCLGAVMAQTDVTEQRRLAGQLRQSQRMEAIGQLAGGVAHDFNNLLTVILSYSQLLSFRLAPEDPARVDLAEIERAGMRAAALTRQLLAFSRQQVLQPKVLDINAVLSDTQKMLQRLIGANVELVSSTAADLKRVRADPGQVEQVILNLALNARDAMPLGGKLLFETANFALDATALAGMSSDIPPGQYVMLAVSDTGCGMDAATRAKIFEPFFTTKEVGKGTGLGLSTVHGIIQQSGGLVSVYSEPGRGTTFKVFLPMVEEAAEPALAPLLSITSWQGTESVLLVEDEPAVRNVISATLRMNGYRVLEASDGVEALVLCRQPETVIDLILTDVVMPRMSGADLVKHAREVHPTVPVIYTSGYTGLAVVHQGVLSADAAFLQKPFTSEGLLRKVRQVLDELDARAA